MALDIVNSSNYINQSGINLSSHSSQTSQQTGGVSYSESNGSTVTINAKDLGLQTGQTFSGQVVSIDGKDIKLMLDNNQTINAKVDGNINAQLGQIISFEVKSTEGGQTALRPLYTNLATSLAVSNALQSAGLPENPVYTRMVSSMMDEGMNINKNALWDMSKDVALHPNADPKTIVQMAKLSLPIDELTINQFENYKSFEHQIKDDVIGLSKGLTDLVDRAIKEANPEIFEAETKNVAENPIVKSAGNLLNSFINAISGNKEQEITNPTNIKPEVGSFEINQAIGESQKGENIPASEDAVNDALSQEGNTPEVKPFDTSGIKIASQVLDLIDLSSNINSDELNETAPDKILKLIDELVESGKSKEPIIQSETLGTDTTDETKTLEEQGINQTEPKAEKMTLAETLNLIKNSINDLINNESEFPQKGKELLSKLLTDNDFKSIIQNTLTKQVLLKPENGVSGDKIQELYDRITKQADEAARIVTESGKESPEVMKSAQNLNDNVSFMNQLNQAVTYIQIPLMMNNKSAHGDLYVYTNKKNLKNNDGNLSALLHLDMDNLGPMDVYVALQNGTKVKTHFMLKDEATIDFLSGHMDILNDRLTKKGYNVSTNFTVKDSSKGPTNIAEEFMKESPEETVRTISKFSFDVRA